MESKGNPRKVEPSKDEHNKDDPTKDDEESAGKKVSPGTPQRFIDAYTAFMNQASRLQQGTANSTNVGQSVAQSVAQAGHSVSSPSLASDPTVHPAFSSNMLMAMEDMQRAAMAMNMYGVSPMAMGLGMSPLLAQPYWNVASMNLHKLSKAAASDVKSSKPSKKKSDRTTASSLPSLSCSSSAASKAGASSLAVSKADTSSSAASKAGTSSLAVSKSSTSSSAASKASTSSSTMSNASTLSQQQGLVHPAFAAYLAAYPAMATMYSAPVPSVPPANDMHQKVAKHHKKSSSSSNKKSAVTVTSFPKTDCTKRRDSVTSPGYTAAGSARPDTSPSPAHTTGRPTNNPSNLQRKKSHAASTSHIGVDLSKEILDDMPEALDLSITSGSAELSSPTSSNDMLSSPTSSNALIVSPTSSALVSPTPSKLLSPTSKASGLKSPSVLASNKTTASFFSGKVDKIAEMILKKKEAQKKKAESKHYKNVGGKGGMGDVSSEIEVTKDDPLHGTTSVSGGKLSERQVTKGDPLHGITNVSGGEVSEIAVTKDDPLHGTTSVIGREMSEIEVTKGEPLHCTTSVSGEEMSERQVMKSELLHGTTSIHEKEVPNTEPLHGKTSLQTSTQPSSGTGSDNTTEDQHSDNNISSTDFQVTVTGPKQFNGNPQAFKTDPKCTGNPQHTTDISCDPQVSTDNPQASDSGLTLLTDNLKFSDSDVTSDKKLSALSKSRADFVHQPEDQDHADKDQDVTKAQDVAPTLSKSLAQDLLDSLGAFGRGAKAAPSSSSDHRICQSSVDDTKPPEGSTLPTKVPAEANTYKNHIDGSTSPCKSPAEDTATQQHKMVCLEKVLLLTILIKVPTYLPHNPHTFPITHKPPTAHKPLQPTYLPHNPHTLPTHIPPHNPNTSPIIHKLPPTYTSPSQSTHLPITQTPPQ